LEQGLSKPEPDGVRDCSRAADAGLDGGPSTDPIGFAPRCLSIDLEVGRDDGQIHRFAAIRGDTGESFHFRSGHLQAGLAELDRLADGAAFLVGHNLIDFDAKYLAAADPDLRLLRLPQVDTLRLNPLAFPRNPYHHLVKHYQDGQLKHGSRNDPELDARLTLGVFRDQHQALRVLSDATPELVLAYHWLTTVDEKSAGLDAFFATVRHRPRPSAAKAVAAIRQQMSGMACLTQVESILKDPAARAWPLAYVLGWLSVSGGNSVMPPWVRHQFPEAGVLVRMLRDTACSQADCGWCRERHDARRELQRFFNLSEFRPEPRDAAGRSLQETIVEAGLRGEHLLGILPTGTGKSLCYQIPALSRYEKTGALTVVISPLVALMADQVAGLEARGVTCCAAINGLLSMPERADILDRIRLGDIGILIIAPEQLRSRSLRRVLEQREIGAWVMDEAHCLSKWGHDFRPDYRYVGRFIKEKAGTGAVPPITCLTATAKPDVTQDILVYFRDRLGIELGLFDGGASRENLEFAVVPTSPAEKFSHVHQILQADLPAGQPGGAIVYCATRRQTEEVARFLRDKDVSAAFFHAGLPPETKKGVQAQFIRGELRVIVATNAFGMGIDKPDVRLVIHADIPGSLENYLQEAGRAGRDREQARCVLLYTPEDVERQFGMSARSRLSQREIQTILKALRNLDRKKHTGGEVIATAGEILLADEDGTFDRDSATDDTRVRTAVAWLEEAELLQRNENLVQIFPSSLRVGSLDEAKGKIDAGQVVEPLRTQLLAVVDALINADADQGVSTDELMSVAGLSPDGVRRALYALEQLGIASNDTALTAYLHVGVDRPSHKRLSDAAALESALIGLLREAAPDLGSGEASLLNLRHATQHLKDAGHPSALPQTVSRLLASLAKDGSDEIGGAGNLRLRRWSDAETVQVWLHREWDFVERAARLRRAAAERLLEHLLSCLPPGSRGTDLLAETTLGRLLQTINDDLVLKAEVRDTTKLLERALLWLHEQEVLRLNKGLAVFRPAMTIRLGTDRRSFVKADFAPLRLHYDEQVIQIHVMAEYVQRGLARMADALQLSMDYFTLDRERFLQRWLAGREKELAQQTTPASWRAIVESLRNPHQQRIVADEREQTNVLILAGPGSGKTRVLVHRIAYLVRARRENPHSILALAYNRHAAVEIRRRLVDLIGDDARGVTVLTCHGLAMRLAGVSFADRVFQASEGAFEEVLQQAIRLLRGDGLAPEEADEQRDRLLAGFRWILVDEYQDIGAGQYDLISALAGRTRTDEDGKLSLLAVGDDDQNIYAFNGASVKFIRRFESDYSARPAYLTENYRSSAHVVAASNLIIEPALERMKSEHPITADRARKAHAPGGRWESIDPIARGRVQVLRVDDDAVGQAIAAVDELRRLASLDPEWNWAEVAIIARDWQYLDPVRAYCERLEIETQRADEDTPSFWQLRETQVLLSWLDGVDRKLVDGPELVRWMAEQPDGPWWALLREAVEQYLLEMTAAEVPVQHFKNWLAEWGRHIRRRQTGLMLLSAHRAKGLEFRHVAVLDGSWDRRDTSEDVDAARRLYYVATTRAQETLVLARWEKGNAVIDALPKNGCLLQRRVDSSTVPRTALLRTYARLSMRHIDLGFAGRHLAAHPVHAAIRSLRPGDPVELVPQGERLELRDEAGRVVGRLAKAYSIPSSCHCVEARVGAIIARRREDTEADYRNAVRCDQWEVVVPELVFDAD
jgi:ATP-dependent DNA helicase RecQ